MNETPRSIRAVTLVTMLLDPGRYPKQDVAELYGLRWQIEVNLRYLKTMMRMDVLRCQTADGIHREPTTTHLHDPTTQDTTQAPDESGACLPG